MVNKVSNKMQELVELKNDEPYCLNIGLSLIVGCGGVIWNSYGDFITTVFCKVGRLYHYCK
jgi:hypothetical protein